MVVETTGVDKSGERGPGKNALKNQQFKYKQRIMDTHG